MLRTEGMVNGVGCDEVEERVPVFRANEVSPRKMEVVAEVAGQIRWCGILDSSRCW